MTDWIKHTTDTCPVDPDTVVEVRFRGGMVRPADKARDTPWGIFWVGAGDARTPPPHPLDVTHYRIITPAPTPPLFLGGDPAKPPETEMTKTAQERAAAMVAATKPEPDFVALRLECLKLAVSHFGILDREQVADRLLHYVLNGSVDKA
jgi:hypothetical protein